MAARMLTVTQVAPYADGPAGAHGVLGQAERALAGIADLHGLHHTPVRDVRDLDDAVLHEATVIALFTIGETPWTPAQRRKIGRAHV